MEFCICLVFTQVPVLDGPTCGSEPDGEGLEISNRSVTVSFVSVLSSVVFLSGLSIVSLPSVSSLSFSFSSFRSSRRCCSRFPSLPPSQSFPSVLSLVAELDMQLLEEKKKNPVNEAGHTAGKP